MLIGDDAAISYGYKYAIPVMINGTENLNAKDIAVGTASAFVLNSNGNVYSWGNNEGGALGRGNPVRDGSVPGLVLGIDGITPLSNVIAISGFSDGAIAISKDGTLKGWGSNEYGTLIRPYASSYAYYNAVSLPLNNYQILQLDLSKYTQLN